MSDRKKFSGYETNLLLELVNKYKGVLESKRNCAPDIEKKTKCWAKLAEEFNEDPLSSKWTPDQLKKKWENQKFAGKKDIAKERRTNWKKTGGGPKEHGATSQSYLIAAIVPEQLGPIDRNQYDDDAEFHENLDENHNSDPSTSRHGVEGEGSQNEVEADNEPNHDSMVQENEEHTDQHQSRSGPQKGKRRGIEKCRGTIIGFAHEVNEKKLELLKEQINTEVRKRQMLEEEHELTKKIKHEKLKYWSNLVQGTQDTQD